MIENYMKDIKKMWGLPLIFQTLNFGLIVATAFILWKGLMIITNCESPVVVVLSGSMEPAYFRGDVLFLTNYEVPIDIGDVVVYKLPGQEIPIVHRSHIIQDKTDGEIFLLTKGDNNSVDDRGLYPRGENWISRSQVLGRIRGYVPYAGYFTIMFADYPILKYALIIVMALVVIVAKDPQS